MAEQIQMGTYRLNVLTYNGNPDINSAARSGRIAVLYGEKPLIQMATFRMTALMSPVTNPDLTLGAKSARMAMLYSEKPIIRQATFRMAALTSTTLNPDLSLAAKSARVAVLYKPPTLAAKAGRFAFLIQQKETGPAAYVPQALLRTFQKADWPTVANTISTTRVRFASEFALQRSPLALPWSKTHVRSATETVLQRSAIAFQASLTRASTLAMLALTSDLKEYHPVSMDYVMNMALPVLQKDTSLKIWKSDITARSSALYYVQKTPMGFLPRSTTVARQTALKVAQATPMGYLPWSDTRVRSTALKVLQYYQNAIPDQGTNEVREEVLKVLQKVDTDRSIVGPVAVRQSPMKVLQQVIAPVVQSVTRAPSASLFYVQRAEYLPPDAIGRRSALQAVLTYVSEETDYVNPDIIASTTRARQNVLQVLSKETMTLPQGDARVPQAFIAWVQGANYPKPGDMIPVENAALGMQLAIQTVQDAPTDSVQSETSALQLVQLSAQYLFYPLASDLATRGLFVSAVARTVAAPETYPDPAIPVSALLVDQIAEIIATPDDKFSDPTKEAQPGYAYQVTEIYAVGDEYPDPTVSQVSAEAGFVAVHFSISSDFPDPNLPVSLAELTQISIQGARNADYPNPENLVSPAEVSQVVRQVSQVSTFPNPVNPASTLTVNQVMQSVAQPDATLYGIPEYETKHRPIITISIVYIQTP